MEIQWLTIIQWYSTTFRFQLLPGNVKVVFLLIKAN